MAHGAAGLLSFLSLTTLRGREVDGQRGALTVLTRWFDRWRRDCSYGPWWPQSITRDDLRTVSQAILARAVTTAVLPRS